MTVRYSPAAVDGPCVAYATPRRLGTAVVRNRIRRRLRAVFDHIASTEPALVPPGDYLVLPSGTVASAPFDELVADCTSALDRIQRARRTRDVSV